ncbi:MAG: hypothetical protein Q9208_000543 [Pyrenodesmia sp. 3 TL-2023]
MSASTLISLPYTCTHTAPFLVREISPAAYDAKYASREKGEDEPTVLFAPVGQVDSVVALLTNGGVWGEECPGCLLRKGEEGGKSEERWTMLEAAEGGEVLFDAETSDGDAVEMEKEVGGEEDRVEEGQSEVEGWWDIIDLEAEDAEAEVESDDEVMEFIQVL